ncbi:probable cytosolic oligopeptidase A isoform X1 [Pogonomyrmex barbatus]|uniref:Probable cytosolic oligopeptidase A isoform X1 n=2 Tax=Pogonomyrmex barbatus TaxID=144034 RepID=A0A6I9W076_9HYME|nr:probable cytosolic oligopeptidase A isoform X1 [Pogonomyrmex barbatus]
MAVSFFGRRIASTRRNFLKIPKRHGYIVLLPEIGEESSEKNPLLKNDNLPEFNTITIEKCIAAIGKQTVDFEEKMKSLEKVETRKNLDVFNDWLHPIEEAYLPLETTWGIAKTLYFGNQSLMPTKCYVGIHERATRAIASKFGSKPLFKACKEALDNKDSKLTHSQKRVLTKYVLEGTLNGLQLQDKEFEMYSDDLNYIMSKIKEYKAKYESSTAVYSMTIQNKHIVEDFPENYLKSIALNPTQPYAGPWIITLKPYILQPFMEYCPDRKLRAAIWDADVTRCSNYQERSVQASVTLEELRARRIEQAKRLGFKNYAEMSMETKMAGNLENLHNTLEILRSTAFPAQEQEIASLTEFAKERDFDDTLRVWDIAFWGRKQRRNMFNCDENKWRPYFPLPTVLSGLFEHIETLFNVKIVESKKADIWHKDVWFFNIFDLNISSTVPIANFYLDPYARGAEKFRKEQDSGWISTIKSKSKVGNSTPLIALIFNFPPPVGDKPSLLSFRDVQVLFQKFGHGLQHLLTTVEYSDIAGLSFVEWDAVFICDYFMENWLYEPFILQKISKHYETNEPLPAEAIESIKRMRSHLAGYKLCKELYLSHLDLELHSSETFWVQMMKRLWPKYFVLPLEKRDVHVCNFDVIWSGNWAAAYFSKVWSEMIAADLYTAFQEIKSDKSQQKELGMRFRNTFLSLGGSYPAAEVFRKFRGRDPSPQALLDNLGLTQTAKGVKCD